jgi:hypothetical protein
MRVKSLWIGLATLWILAGLVAFASVTAPEQRTGVAKVGDIAAAQLEADAPVSPLDAVETDRETGPAGHAPVEETPNKPAEMETAAPGPVPVEPEKVQERSSRPSVVIDSSNAGQPTSYADVTVTAGGTLTLPTGEISVDGDWANNGTVHASGTSVVFDGDNQTLEGNLTAKKVVLRGGTKRIRGNFSTNGSENADPGKAGLYVEAGTTLIIETGGKWTTPNPYGFQIAGNLVIDGGEFHCRFSNGNGTDRGEESWLAGSTLTINSGKFVGNGDADFSGATITIHNGSLDINDDIWSTGDALSIFGGSMRNTTGGGMFYMTGTVSVRDGKLQVFQNSGRSLRIAKDASVYCTGGEISINGSAATDADGGIYLGNSATLPDLVINADTKIHKDSVENAYLSVAGDMSIAKGRKFQAMGRQVISNFTPGDESGEFIP